MRRGLPIWAEAIRKKYGDFKSVCNIFHPSKVAAVGANPTKALSMETPSLVRLNATYGDGAARQWLYIVLQSCLRMLGVESRNMADGQVSHLADVIVATYPWLTMAEFLLFIHRFEAGMYERFYGDASYFHAVTKSLVSFMYDRNEFLSEMEAQRKRSKRGDGKAVSYPDYVRQTKYKKKADILRQAETVLNHNRLLPSTAKEVDEAFKANYGMTPKEYIEKEKKEHDKE